LSPCRSRDAAELWVLRQDGLDRLRTLVEQADDVLVARLAFAVAEQDGRLLAVVRVRPGRLPPPVLLLDVVGFRPYLRLPNLFLPCGARLHPSLRRDVAVELLAPEPGHIGWLYPGADGSFVRENLPEAAFRPLPAMVDYVLERPPRVLSTWVQTTGFDFESFTAQDEPAVRKTSPPPGRQRGQLKPEPAHGKSDKNAAPKKPVPRTDKERGPTKAEAPKETPLPKKAGELEHCLRTLEQQFLELTAPPDAHERRELWREMGQLNAALGQGADAALCWLNAFWEEDNPEPAALRTWLRAEGMPAEPGYGGREWDRVLALRHPEMKDLRGLAALLVEAAHAGRPVPGAAPLLGRLQRFLEKHEGLLPVRGAWLAWVALCRLARHDVLALTRARDRLLERLYLRGLSREQDLPGFLRFTGVRASSHFRQVRDQVPALRRLARRWLADEPASTAHTAAYADLIFAFSLARLGEAAACHKLLHQTHKELGQRDEVHTWLSAAFEYRIRQALDGKPAAGALPATLRGQLQSISGLGRYKVDRLREVSRILEPHENLDPLRKWIAGFADPLGRELATLHDLDDRGALADRLTRLLGRRTRGPEAAEVRILAAALELAPRLGEAFAGGLFDRLGPALDRTPGVVEQALLLEKGLFLAAHFDRAEQVQALGDRFQQLLQAPPADTLPALEGLLGQCFRGLRKLGMRDAIGRLMERMADLVAHQEDLLKLKKDAGAPPGSQSRAWQLLLHVAAGWFALGQQGRAWPLLDRVRDLLIRGQLPALDQTAVMCAYADTLSHAPIDRALPRLAEVFRRLDPVSDTFTTNSHFSLSRLDVVEAVVLALVSDDLMLNPEARRWLEEDEFFVRRRIHRDVRAALSQAGLGP
jgi:hypothetical protein